MSEDHPDADKVIGVAHPPSLTGRTIGDVFDDILVVPKRAVVFVLLVSAVAVLVISTMVAFSKLFSVQPSEIRLGATNSDIVLERVEKNSDSEDYLAIVNPQGWQKSGIPIHQGDRVSLVAGGKICIDMNSIWEKVQLRLKYEDEIAQAKGIRRDDKTETRAPEDFFTDEQKRSLVLERPWVDPRGFDLERFQPSFRSRSSRYLLVGKPAGGLIAGIVSDSEEPVRSDAFFVGNQSSFTAAKDGLLWFTVNDVQFDDPNNRNLFYNDNIGSFWVRVTIKHGK
jgi:hypothetical protein